MSRQEINDTRLAHSRLSGECRINSGDAGLGLMNARGTTSMAKKLVIFADGTGNAFFKQESNIWRLFDALDTSQNDQIAYYIEGVGTSSFRPWAMFDGATGVGAPGNIRKLYRFLCWNWEENEMRFICSVSAGERLQSGP